MNKTIVSKMIFGPALLLLAVCTQDKDDKLIESSLG